MARYVDLHEWDVTAQRAVELQKQFRDKVKAQPPEKEIKTIAGADLSYNKYSEEIFVGVVVLSLPDLKTVEQCGITGRATFPYVPGLLTFREAPSILQAWSRLKIEPDAVMIDGHGISHPRRMGIAAHIGLALDRPTFGCGKSLLTGKFEEPGKERGSWSPLIDRGETIGAVLRTKRNVQPVFVSVGNLIDLESAISLTMQCDGGYRIPEPTRRAHNFVNALRRGEISPS